MICPTCNIPMSFEEYYYVCTSCGCCNFDEPVFVNDISDSTHIFHPVQYSRKEYFCKLLHKFHIPNKADHLKLFDKYTKSFDILQPRKYLLPRKYVLNKFCEILKVPKPFTKPMKTYKSFVRNNKIWDEILTRI